MRLEMDGAQTRLLASGDGSLGVDAVRRRLVEGEHAVKMGLGGDERLAGGDGLAAHLVIDLFRALALVRVEAELVGEVEDMLGAGIVVDLRRQRVAEARTAPEPFLTLRRQRLHLARLETDVGRAVRRRRDRDGCIEAEGNVARLRSGGSRGGDEEGCSETHLRPLSGLTAT